MFCPDCRTEHAAPATVCRECGENLVVERPAEPPPEGELVWVDMVTVLRSSELAEVLVAKSVLQAYGIRFTVRNELLQDLLAPRFIGGFNPLTGPMEIRVALADEADARQVLAHAVGPHEAEGE